MTQDTPTHQDEPGAPRAQLGFGHTPTPDPVDAAIERHRVAYAELERATTAVGVAETASRQAEEEAETARKAASVADGAAWADLIATRPASLPGAVRLLRYVSTSPDVDSVEDTQDLLRKLTAAVEAAEAGDPQGSGAPVPGETVAAIEPDPALAVVAEFRDAWDALGKAIDAAGGAGVPEVDPAIEDREGEAYERLKTVRPTTPEGFRALAGAWALVLNGERMGEPGVTHADHAADSLIAGAGACVPTDPVDWTKPPPGFMASPAIEPFGFVIVEEGLRIELERLHGIALAEFSRRTGPETTAERAERLRRVLRLDALEKAVVGEGGCAVSPAWDWQAEAARHPGFVPFPAHAPRIMLALDEAIRREAGRLLELAEAEIERSRLAHAGNTDPTLWPRVERDMRREMRMDALALVAADLPDDDGAPDPVLAAIAASRRAEAEMAAFQDATCGDQLEAWTAREDELCKVQQDTREAVWRTIPTTYAGRRALVDYARFQVEVHTGKTGIIDSAKDLFDEILAPIAAAIDAERPEAPGGLAAEDPDAAALVSGIEAEWRTWAGLHGAERDDAAFEASCQRRDALLDAAEALPASSRAARHAKALARAWVDWVEDERPGRPRGVYSFEGRLVFDVHTSIAAAKEDPAGSHRNAPMGYDLASLTVAQLARLYGALEPFEDLIGRAETVRTPDGDIICQEADRLGRLVRAIAEEIGRRRPASGVERIDRLNVLVRRAALLDDLTTDRALLTEALAACED